MLRLLRWLIWGDGHMHKWEMLRHGDRVHGPHVLGLYYDCRCTVCGKIRSFNT